MSKQMYMPWRLVGGSNMKVLFSPQLNDKFCIEYKFYESNLGKVEIIEATLSILGDENEKGKREIISEEQDTFDFSDLPDGVLEDVKTTLSINPIISAKKENGELYVKLLNFIDTDATEEERFPEWQVIEGGRD